MKIAIHYSPGSFSERWIEYCKQNSIDYKIVNAYDSDIIQQVNDCDAFMWHHHHGNYKDVLFAKQLLYSLQIAGKKVFPDFSTGWHFDDKVGQKYLFEAIGVPLVPSYVFYTKAEAIHWANETAFPKVFKLRGGAGAANVKLVRTRKEAMRLINKAFGKGFSQFDKWGNLKERFEKWKAGEDSFVGLLKGVARLVISTEFTKFHAPEKGYVYFQEFIPDNYYDVRLIVIGGSKAYGMKRLCRNRDFRASGSGMFVYDEINTETLTIAFKVAKRLNLQSVAFDFIYEEGKPLLVEASYGYGTKGSSKCTGYWTEDLSYHEETFIPQYWMIENLYK